MTGNYAGARMYHVCSQATTAAILIGPDVGLMPPTSTMISYKLTCDVWMTEQSGNEHSA